MKAYVLFPLDFPSTQLKARRKVFRLIIFALLFKEIKMAR